MTSWTPADTYNPDAFYTEGTDKKGQGERITIRIPPRVARGISKIVQSGKIPPYETLSDFVRNAIVHQLHKDADRINDGSLKHLVNMVALLNEEITLSREEEDYYQIIGYIESHYAGFLGQGKIEQAQRYIKERLSRVDDIPPRFQDDYDKRLGAKLYPI
jgi:Arc/MetJ-type ribon-helix-helix transcriptional regulator